MDKFAKKSFTVARHLLVFQLLLSMFSCQTETPHLSIMVQNDSSDTIHAAIMHASDALVIELSGMEQDYVKRIFPGQRVVVWHNAYYRRDSYKLYVTKDKNYVIEDKRLSVFDYARVYNYSELEALNFLITVKDI